jgi:hypothetical protein
MSVDIESDDLSKKAIDVFGDLGAIDRLSKDLKNSVKTLNRDEVRTLVDYYYIIQDNRKSAHNQTSQLEKSGEPHALLNYVKKQADILETQIKNAMNFWTEEHIVAKIIKEEVYGVGPVISAGLVAYFDIHRAATAGAFWRYAGLDPSAKWLSRDKVKDWVKDNKDVPVDDLVFKAALFFGRNASSLQKMASTDSNGKPVKLTHETLVKALCRRPYNASLKTLCWKIGECFMKFSNRAKKVCPNCDTINPFMLNKPDSDEEKDICKKCNHDITNTPAIPLCFYGQLYRKQKQYLITLNQSGKLSNTASETLSKKNIQDAKTLALYKNGMLSDGHIEGMAKRFAVKLFLSNLHELWCAIEKIPCPKPYAMSILGHAHYVCQPEILDYINKAKA